MPRDDLKCRKEECKGKVKDFDRPPCFNGSDLPPCPECKGEMQVNWMAKRTSHRFAGKSFKTHGEY